MYVDVVVPLALPKILTYHCDDHESIQTGLRVIVQVAKKQYTGIVYTINQKPPSYKTKPIIAVLDEKPILQPEQLQLWSWISRYYMCSLGELMIAGMPNSLKLQSDTYYITHVISKKKIYPPTRKMSKSYWKLYITTTD